jgi:la-related protein 1
MSSTESRAPTQASPAPPVFSYAQAAKGRASATGSQISQATSGISTPAKESHSPMLTLSNSFSGAAAAPASVSDGTEKVVNGTHEPVTKADPLGLGLESESKSSTVINTASMPASPSLGTESTYTLPKEEDLSLQGATQSESAWDRNANEADKAADAEARRLKKGKKKTSEKEAEKDKEEEKKPEILVAAPPPPVNIWQQRREAQALKVKPSPPIVQGPQAFAETASEVAKLADAKKRTKSTDLDAEKSLGATQNGTKDSSNTNKGKKGPDGTKGKDDASNKRVGPRGSRGAEKEEKGAVSQLPPPVEDAISWPAPETAVEQEKRRAQEEKERSEREKEERDETSSNKPRPKEKWVTVPYVPTVNFSTPLPPRGGRGRGGGRGGRDNTGRGSSGDKANNTSTTASPSDAESRGRGTSTTSRAASLPPNSTKRHSTDFRPQGKFTTTANSDRAKAGQGSDGRRSSAQMEQSFDGHQEQFPRGDAKGDQAAFHEDGARSGSVDQKGDLGRGPDQAANLNKESSLARDGRVDRGRGGYRGRGGHNGYQNGQQQPQHTSTNGHAPQPPNGFAVRQNANPFSPSMPPAAFGSQFTPPAGRGGRAGPRSQSIPNAAMLSRFPPGVGPQPLGLLQTPGMFEYQPMQPMSAIPYHSYVDQFSVLAMVSMQLEYYFSIDNLCKDVFLRKHMDSQGFVFLAFIADFKRIQALTKDLDMLRFACQESEVIDIIKGEDNVDRIRRNEGWEKWVLAMEERDESVRNAGPSFHHRQQRPQQMAPMMLASPHAMSPAFSPTSTDPFRPFANGAPLVPMNGNGGLFHPETLLSAAVPDFAPGALPVNGVVDPLEAETTFFDDDVANLKLVFATPKGSENTKQTPHHNASARTFSNGSIDGRAVTEDIQEDRQGRGLTNGSHVPET